jgi:hypothetical protein
MESHPRKQVDARVKQEPHGRAKQLIREWCDEQYERMMAEMPERKAGHRPTERSSDNEKGSKAEYEGDPAEE